MTNTAAAAQTFDATELMKFVASRDLIAARIEADGKYLGELRRKISAICPHAMTVKKSHFSSGGYDYRSQSSNWDECVICGAHLNSQTREGDFA